jgi:hypothetical protein
MKNDTFVGLFATLNLNTNEQQSLNNSFDVQNLELGLSHTVNTSSYRSHAT